ncbi:ankyrin repeat [Fusarium albosuccineum]|uniref:phospholipase A2 n=1 Tax=Fusarium albosuccineum TaxID=1237068 RepID=A0A8H4PB44_9HYPO|nr:ankyrin repeat [Fusarium albosuccineum]
MAATIPAGQRPLRLLSLDGGGIRGLSSIIILKEIMRQVNRDVPANQHLQPWQVFDLIGGTSTGGIIAAMLGRLRMSLKECEEAYLKLGKDIFEPKRARWDGRRLVDFVQANEKFDSSILESSIKTIIGEKTGDENSPLKPLNAPADVDCKVFVCSVLEVNSEPVFLRTYEAGSLADPLSDDFELWQALRATSAASTFFDAYQHGVKKFVDGGFAYNNPVQRVMVEAADLWGNNRPTVLISIGTGESLGESLGGNLMELAQRMARLVTQTERTADDFSSSHRTMVDEGMYFRFNVPGLATIGMQEYKEVHAIDGHTIGYLNKGPTGRDLSAVVRKIRDIRDTDDLDSTDLKVVDLDKQDQECMQALFLRAGDYENHRAQLDSPVDGTCFWISQHPKFTNFRDSKNPSLLWITGNPGCGKSVLARFLADRFGSVVEAGENGALAPIVCSFFFKDGQDRRTQSQSAVSALLHQLFTARPILSQFGRAEYAAKGNDFTQSPETVWQIMCEACSRVPQREVICIVDALDECSEHSRNRFIRMVLSTFLVPDAKKTAGSLKVLVTSRPWPEIEAKFGPNSTIRLRGEDETRALAHDIGIVVERRVQDLECNGILTTETGRIVKKILSEKADGTFLWISLALESIISLRSRTLSAVEQKLAGIPKDLDALYAHALPESDDETEVENSRRLLSIMLAATRMLSLDEIGICLSLDSTTKELCHMEREPDLNHTVKSLGGFFIRIAQSKVSLVHQTAREYLLRDDNVVIGKSWKHSISLIESNLTLAHKCVQFLVLPDWAHYVEELTNERSLGMYAERLLNALKVGERGFYKYAARNWFKHIKASSNNDDLLPEELRGAIHTLCDQSKTTFAIWWSCYAGSDFWGKGYSGKYHLHYAVDQGDLVVLREILRANSLPITAESSFGCDLLTTATKQNRHEVLHWILSTFASRSLDTGPALITAIRNGNKSSVEGIIEKGNPDINRRYSGETPLEIAVRVGEMGILQLLLDRGANPCDEGALKEAAHPLCEAIMCFLVRKIQSVQCNDPNQSTDFLQRALEMALTQNMAVEVVNLVINQGLGLSSRFSLPFQLANAARKGDVYDVMRLVGDGPCDHRGIALILGSYHPEILDVLLGTQNYDRNQIWTAFRYLDSGMAGFYRKLLSSRTDAGYTAQRSPLLATNRSMREEDKCLQLFLRSLTGLEIKFPNNAITHLLCCVSGMDESRLRTSKARLRKALNDMTQETAASFFTLASLFGAAEVIYDTSPQFDVNLKDRHGMTPLMAAVLARSNKLVYYLLELGANPGTISWYEPSEVDVAIEGMAGSRKALTMDLAGWNGHDDWLNPSTPAQAQTEALRRYLSAEAIDWIWETIWAVLDRHTFVESPLSLGRKYQISAFKEPSKASSRFNSATLFNNQPTAVAQYALGFLEYKNLFKTSRDDAIRYFIDLQELDYTFFDDVPARLVLPTLRAPSLTLNGRLALHLAAERGLDSLILELIRREQSVSVVDEEGRTPLHYYAGSDISTVKAMLDAGASLEAVDKAGYTPLHTAIKFYSTSAEIFIQLGSSVNAKTHDDRTPLHEAVEQGPSLSLVKGLLERGAEPLARDASGLTPLHYAIREADLMGYTEIVKYLVQKTINTGEPLAVRNGHSGTAMDDVMELLGSTSRWEYSGLEQDDILNFYNRDVASIRMRADSLPLEEGFWDDHLSGAESSVSDSGWEIDGREGDSCLGLATT